MESPFSRFGSFANSSVLQINLGKSPIVHQIFLINKLVELFCNMNGALSCPIERSEQAMKLKGLTGSPTMQPAYRDRMWRFIRAPKASQHFGAVCCGGLSRLSSKKERTQFHSVDRTKEDLYQRAPSRIQPHSPSSQCTHLPHMLP